MGSVDVIHQSVWREPILYVYAVSWSLAMFFFGLLGNQSNSEKRQLLWVALIFSTFVAVGAGYESVYRGSWSVLELTGTFSERVSTSVLLGVLYVSTTVGAIYLGMRADTREQPENGQEKGR